MAESYEKAGVNLEAGYEVVRRIKKHVASTARTGVMGTIGAFGGMFDLAALGVKEPVLVSGTDGVGTKLKLAFALDKHDTIGIDAVAMCVNDVLAQGAEPLFFLDYVAVGHNEPVKIEGIVCGVAEGCRQAGCALVGGETAEMPGMYEGGEYDIAGFTVGVVERSRLIDGSKVKTGDVLVGIASSGVHSNGFSLVRKVLSDNGLELNKVYPELSNRTLGEVLLTPTKIYVKPVLDVIRRCDVHGISHITGGGFDENIPRILHEGQGIAIEEGTWEILPVFRFLEKYGKIAHREMFNIFNMGVGMVIALDAEEAQKAVDILASHGEQASVIGRVTDSEGVVIAAACERGAIAAEVALVVCDRPGARVTERAAARGIACFAFAPKEYASKADYEREIVARLDAAGVDLVCLAGYMRILSEVLLGAYGGRIVNIHPSLLPAFKGAHAIEEAVAYGVKVYGVTIHWVDATLDGGRIIAQRAFAYDGDDVHEVERRVHEVEHELYVETIDKLVKA